MIQHIIDAGAYVERFVFEKFISKSKVPEEDILIETLCAAFIKGVCNTGIEYKTFPEEPVEFAGGGMSEIVVIGASLNGILDHIIRAGITDSEVDSLTDIAAKDEAGGRHIGARYTFYVIDQAGCAAIIKAGIEIEIALHLFDSYAVGEKHTGSPVAIDIDRLCKL